VSQMWTTMTTMERIAGKMLNHLQMVLATPTSRPMVKWKNLRPSVKSHHLRTSQHRWKAIMTVHLLLATPATRNGLNLLHFDSESAPIRIDNCCSKCISNDIQDFIPSTIRNTNKVVRGFKGEECAATCRGTIKWSWDDDLGVCHTFRIPNSYCVPEAISKLLCPQHWAQEAADHSPTPHGTGCNTNDTSVTLYWEQGTKKRTVPLDPSLNVGILHTTTGYRTSDAQCTAMETVMVERGALCSCDAGLPSDDEDDHALFPFPVLKKKTVKEPALHGETEHSTPSQLIFDLQGPEEVDNGQVDVDEEDHIDEPAAAKMLREHHRLAHLPFSHMRAMARAGLLPGTFLTCREPLCSSCLYGKATRRPWRTKASPDGGLKRATFAGQCVAVDQCESPVPGLVAQLKGIPTKKRYT